MVYVVKVKPEEKDILNNLLEKYLYEMTAYYGDEMKDSGNFDYPYLPLYFAEKERRPYFICDENKRIGFSLINQHSFTEEAIPNCIAEFTIFPAYRRLGKGLAAVEALKSTGSGKWQLKYSTNNSAAAAFWNKVSEKYHGRLQRLEGAEFVLTFS